MISIIDTFQQAQNAEAAYADFFRAGVLSTTKSEVISALVASNFSLAQATTFANTWQIIDQYTVPTFLGLTGTGFSATIFKNIDSSSPNYGKYSLAIRGSTQFNDFTEDAALIVTDGVAVRQLADLYNYWRRVTTAANQTYQAAYVVIRDSSGELPLDAIPVGGSYGILFGDSSLLADPNLRLGVGQIPAGLSALDVSGHSLGGHLAMAFTRLFPGIASNAVAVNGLGFKMGNETVDSLFSALNGTSDFDSSRIQNIYGIDGPEFAAMNNGVLQQPGGWNGIYIESIYPLDPIWGGHGGPQMTDSLALYSLFAKLDPALDASGATGIQAITNILKASSITASRTLETALDAVHKLFDPAGTTATAIDARESYYKHIDELKKSQFFIQSAGLVTLRDLTSFSAAQIASVAQNNLAYRYALLNLNSFALVGDDGLYAQHNANHELNLYDPATGQGQLTQNWLEDRAKMLAAVNIARTADTGTGDKLTINPTGTDSILYTDKPTGLTLRDGQAALDPQRITFGSSASETLSGGLLADHLYGMQGDDALSGGAGADRLEGGAGNDALVGGAGDDILDGGRDVDTLRGGKGNDTYRIDKFGYSDTLIDYAAAGLLDQLLRPAESGDGQGTINYAGTPFAGTLVQDATERNRYHWETNPALVIRYIGDPAGRGNLLVTDPAGASFKIINWKSGELGLGLQATASSIQTTAQQGTGLDDNAYLTDRQHGASLVAGAENEEVFGLGGSDLIELAFAGAIGWGGAGNDVLRNGAGDQRLYGEAGNDILVASGGDDLLDGGADDDRLDGGDGLDILDGGAGSDVINGGAGDDFLFGGGNVTVGLADQGSYSYARFADGDVTLLRKNAAGQFVLPGNLGGVSGTDSHLGEALAYHVEDKDVVQGGARLALRQSRPWGYGESSRNPINDQVWRSAA